MNLIPMDQRDGWIWFDGELVEWKQAKIHVLTHGLHYASCVFEGQRAYKGVIYKLTEHSKRLKKSANILDFEIPYSVEQIDAACKLVLEKNGLIDAYMRPVAWCGSEEMGLAATNNKVHLAIAAWKWPSYFSAEERLKGAKLSWSEWCRPAPNMIPCFAKAAGLYMICTLAKHKAMKEGYTDALMLDYRGYVAEATGANVFFVKRREIHTPIADCFLDGITRQTIIQLAKKNGYKLVERHILPDELNEFDECFLTGSAAEITPVAQIGDINFKPGKACKEFIKLYAEEVQPKS